MRTLDKSRMIFEEYKEYIFAATEFIEPIIDRGQGSFVWDVDGNKYLDLNSGQFCVTFGHNFEPFNEIVEKQMRRIHHTNTMVLTPEVFEAAKKMADINSEGLSKTIFLSTGAEANECAIRYAKFVTKKDNVISLSKGYHGLTHAMQCLTMGGDWARPAIGSYDHIEVPDTLYTPEGFTEPEYIELCLRNAEETISANRESVAAVVIEPILGVGGMIILPQEYVKQLRRICSDNDVLLIVDECQTGFGRTGHWFAYQYYDIVPDIVVTAKIMGQGFPVSAVTFHKDVIADVEGKISHFSSHQNDPLAAVTVSFVIDTIREHNILGENVLKGEYLVDKLRDVSARYPLIRNPRCVGLMAAFDLPIDLVESTHRSITRDLINSLMMEGILIQAIRKGVTFRILPSFSISMEEIDFFVDGLEKAVRRVAQTYDLDY